MIGGVQIVGGVAVVQVVGVNADASSLVRDFALLVKVLHAGVIIKDLQFVLDGFLAIPLKRVGHRHGPLSRRFVLRRL